MTSFDLEINKRNDIARNNLRLNALISSLLLIAAIFPIFMPWYADPTYEDDPSQTINVISRYKKKGQTFLIISLFSVFVNDEWMTINEFIARECPYVTRSGFECLEFDNYQYAAYGVS